MDDEAFLQGYDPAAYDRPSVAVDLVLLGIADGRPTALLVQRAEPPFAGRWALPGGFVGIDEPLDAAARRVLHDKADIADAHLEQLYTFGAPTRDPRLRVISVAYLALLAPEAFAAALAGGGLAAAALEVGEGEVVARAAADAPLSLAFDHLDMLALAVERLRGKLDWSDVGFALLPARFTLRQLQDVHEAVLGRSLNKPAFRRRMLDRGWLAATGNREADASHRPAELFSHRR